MATMSPEASVSGRTVDHIPRTTSGRERAVIYTAPHMIATDNATWLQPTCSVTRQREWSAQGVPLATDRLEKLSEAFGGSPEIPNPRSHLGMLLGTMVDGAGRVSMKAYCDGFIDGEEKSLRTVAQAMSVLGFGEQWSRIGALCGEYGLASPFISLDLHDIQEARVKIYTDTSRISLDAFIDIVDKSGIGSTEPILRAIEHLDAVAGDRPLGATSGGKPRSMLCWSFADTTATSFGLTAYLPVNLLCRNRDDLSSVLEQALNPDALDSANRLKNFMDTRCTAEVPFHWLALKLQTPGYGAGLYTPWSTTSELERSIRSVSPPLR